MIYNYNQETIVSTWSASYLFVAMGKTR